jgi:lysyl-tRNA synthetase, class II
MTARGMVGADNPRALLSAVARAAGLAIAIVVVPVVATGWLYWVRAAVQHVPGPRVRDALPLDELAVHDSVPLVIYLVAFACAGGLLGLSVRALRMTRLVAGLSLTVGVTIWLLLVDTISISVVRQIPYGTAFQYAVGLQAVYLAAILCGAAGAAFGRSSINSDSVQLVKWGIAAGGLVDLLAALFPPPGSHGGRAGGSGPLASGAHVLMVPVGVLLLIGARAAARGNKRALHLTMPLLGLSVLLQLFRGPDYAGAIAAGLILVTVLARRQELPFRGDPAARSATLSRLLGMLALAIAYGVTALWTYRTAAGLPYRWYPAVQDTVRALGGLAPRGGRYVPGDFSHWFRFSVLLIAAIGVFWAAEVWTRPWRHWLRPDARRSRRAEDVVHRWGGDTLAPFALRSDKELFIVGTTLIAYRVVRGVALVCGDPIGPDSQGGPALDAFRAHARARGWTVAILGASDRLLQKYRERGFHQLYHGDEAVVDVSTFTLDGREKRCIRQAVHRLDRAGYQAQVMLARDVQPELRAELGAVERSWLHGKKRTGFTMELDSLFRLGEDDEVFVVGRDSRGRVAGFLHLAVARAGNSLTLSSMPRRADTPNGLNAWLTVHAISWAASKGYAQLSLNFSPFARLLRPNAELSAQQRLWRAALLKLKHLLGLQLDNLLVFNRQFRPDSLPRYIVVEKWTGLLRVVVAAMAAEGYLPKSSLVRGREWSEPPVPAAQPPMPVQQGPAADQVLSGATGIFPPER